MDYTVVIAVDLGHLEQLFTAIPNWRENKPSLFNHKFLVIVDRDLRILDRMMIGGLFDGVDVQFVSWPEGNVVYDGGSATDRFHNPQRHKMLAGFVHVPAAYVQTPYWLKIDLDSVAAGNDNWVSESWFADFPAIIGHPWGYTKPPDQMIKLDTWARHIQDSPWRDNPPLNLVPAPGSSLVSHKRIISWCGFFHTGFTRLCSDVAARYCGEGQIPVPSQDGYHWYMATRGGFFVRRESMKVRGWRHCSNVKGMRQAIEETKMQMRIEGE